MAPASTLSGLGQNVVSNSKQFLPLATTGDKDRIVFRTPLTSTSTNQNQFIRTAVSDIFSVDVEKYTETLIQMEDHVHQTKIKLEKTRKEANKRAKKINEVKGQIRTATADIKVRNSALAQGGRFEGSMSFSLQKELLEALSPQHSLQMVNQLTGKEEQVQDLQKKNQDLSAELETAKSESKRKLSELETVIEELELISRRSRHNRSMGIQLDSSSRSNQQLRDDIGQLGKQLEKHPDEHPEEHPEEHLAQQPAEQPLVFPGALETAASIHDEATIQLPVPPPQVPAALEGHEVNFLKPCPADIQNDKTWIESGEKWTRQDVSVEVRDHIQSYITNTLEPLEKYEGKAKRKWKNDCQTNCVRSRVKNLKRCWNGKKVVKGHACDNCIKAGTTCMMITKHAMVPTILPRAPELREGLTEQDLFFWVKPRVPEIVVLDQ
jgi:chaperonin cofactor prefoldin